LLVAHEAATASVRARELLDDWAQTRTMFRRVVPVGAVEARELLNVAVR